jgi:uncharacterized membrane protein
MSLGGAIGFVLATGLLIVLEMTHRRADPVMAADNERVLKVVLSVLVAAGMSIVSLVYALYPVSKGNLRPLVWLAMVAAGWLALVRLFDFRSLMR